MPQAPRRHHYVFAHRELPSAAFRFGADLIAAARDGRLRLAGVWSRVAEGLSEDERLAGDGLAGAYHQLAGHELLLVTLPPAQGPAEAHFVVLASPTGGGPLRFFTLEYAVSPIDDARYTVLGEWIADGTHLNHGEGPDPEPAALLATIAGLLGDEVPRNG